MRYWWMNWQAVMVLVVGLAWPSLGTEVGTDPEYLIDTWHSEDGLPQNSVTTIAQTADGYLWLGTFNGLARFDGNEFQVFDPANTPELRSGRIMRLCTDSSARLWIMSVEGDVALLEHGRFKHIGRNSGLPTDRLGLHGPDPDGIVWLKTMGEESFYACRGAEFLPVLPAPFDAVTNLAFLAAGAGGNLWSGKPGQWRMFNNLDNQFVSARLYGGEIPFDETRRARDGGFWIEDRQTLRHAKDGKWTRLVKHREKRSCSCLIEDQRGNVWKGSWGAGLERIAPDDEVRVFNFSGSQKPEAVRALFEDAAGNLWVGLDGGGLCRLRHRIFQTYGVAQGLRGRAARSVVEDDMGVMWILNQGSYDRLKPGSPPTIEPAEWSGASAWCAVPGPNHSVWIAGRGSDNVYCVSRERAELVRRASEKPVNEPIVLYRDPAGILWVGAENGLWQLQADGVLHPVAMPSGLETPDVRAITEDQAGRLFVGLNGEGLLRRVGTNWSRIPTGENQADRRIWTLYADADNTIWMGTYGGGLSQFRNGRVFHFRDPKMALPESITCILEDDFGYLWCGSNRGIFRIKRKELNEFADGIRLQVAAEQFDRSDGLETSECTSGNQPTSWKARDGRLWFCLVRGVAVINPREMDANPRPAPVVIQEVRAGDKIFSEFHPGGSTEGDWQSGLAIPAGTDRIDVRFAALSFLDPGKTRYQYRLEPFDRDWVVANTPRIATYTHVPPGSYEFRVMACDEHGIWNEGRTALTFTVLPRYYQTWWFRLTAVGSALALVALAYHFRIHQLQEVSQLRWRIAGDLHDEVGSNLGSIALNSELLQGSASLSQEDRRDLVEINRVATQTSQTIREITWLINPGFDTLPEMLERMKLVATSMLSGRQYDFSAPAGVAPRKLSLEFRRHVFLAYKEILHNVVKHSGARHVSIRVNENGGSLEMSVADDGCGFDEAAIRHGHGLTSLRRRSAALGGSLQITSRAGAGTTISLKARIK